MMAVNTGCGAPRGQPYDDVAREPGDERQPIDVIRHLPRAVKRPVTWRAYCLATHLLNNHPGALNIRLMYGFLNSQFSTVSDFYSPEILF